MTRALRFLFVSLFASLFVLGASSSASATSIADVTLWRTQLRIHTCDKVHAGTDSHVSVILSDRQSTSFYLRAPDDKDRNETRTYDLFIPGVNEIRDITQLTLELHGWDRWCFDRIELIVNSNPRGSGGNVWGFPIFVFKSDTGQWLDRTNGPARFTWSGAALRADPRWTLDDDRRSMQALPSRISKPQIEAMIAGIVGDFVARRPDVRWGRLGGSRHVELTPTTRLSDVLRPARIGLDLERPTTLFAKDLDVGFTLSSTCTDLGSTVAIELFTSNADADLFELFPVLDALLLNVGFGISAAFVSSGFPCPRQLGFDSEGDWTWRL